MKIGEAFRQGLERYKTWQVRRTELEFDQREVPTSNNFFWLMEKTRKPLRLVHLDDHGFWVSGGRLRRSDPNHFWILMPLGVQNLSVSANFFLFNHRPNQIMAQTAINEKSDYVKGEVPVRGTEKRGIIVRDPLVEKVDRIAGLGGEGEIWTNAYRVAFSALTGRKIPKIRWSQQFMLSLPQPQVA